MLNSSRYHHPYAAELTDWITRLSLIRENLEPTLTIQSSLLYLENVFSSVNGSAAASATDAEDPMTVQLQAESAVFASLCKLWGRLMSRVEAHPNVIHTFVVDSTLAHSLPYLEAQLDSCKHALSGYLTGKRVQFPRFFFLSDSALLEVLALSAGIPSVRRHLASMFDSVLDLIIHPRVRSSVIGFVSTGRCKLEFDALHTVHTRGRVESWMQQLLTSSRSAVRSAVITAAQVSAGAATLGRSPLYLLTDTKAQVGEQSDVAGLSSALLSLPPQVPVLC